MFVDPFQHLGMLVSSIVVDNDMDRFLLGHPSVDNGKEADELLSRPRLLASSPHIPLFIYQ